jgi:hypothetical protein
MTTPFAKYRAQLLEAFRWCLETHPYGWDRGAIDGMNFPHGGTWWSMIEDHIDDECEAWWHTRRCDQKSIIAEAIAAHDFDGWDGTGDLPPMTNNRA